MIITFLNGDEVSTSDLTFDAVTGRVYLGSDDVSDEVRFTDKRRLWPRYDWDAWLRRVSNQNQIARGEKPVQEGSTSLLGNFVSQIVTDPFSAPLESADRLGDKIADNSLFNQFKKMLWLLAILAAIGFGIYLFFQVGGPLWLRKLKPKA